MKMLPSIIFVTKNAKNYCVLTSCTITPWILCSNLRHCWLCGLESYRISQNSVFQCRCLSSYCLLCLPVEHLGQLQLEFAICSLIFGCTQMEILWHYIFKCGCLNTGSVWKYRPAYTARYRLLWSFRQLPQRAMQHRKRICCEAQVCDNSFTY